MFVVLLLLWLGNVAALRGLSSLKLGRNAARSLSMTRVPTISDLADMNVKEAIVAVCGPKLDESFRFPNTDIVKQSPGVCRFVIGNPKAFLDEANAAPAALRGLDQTALDGSAPATSLAALLPVLYIADTHPEYGTLGLRLNERDPGRTMVDLFPALRSFRDRPIYLGGEVNSGSSFTMVHRKSGFPENRVWKGVPDKPDFKLFFSPDLAMANELCLTGDARPGEFKFFTWTTVWSPKALELEYKRRIWLTVEAPVDALFCDDLSAAPLWRRLVSSLPGDRI